MKIKFIISLLLIVFSIETYSQQHVAMFKKDAFWGFLDINGTEIVKPKYTYCRNFYGELAKVDKVKLINVKGELIKPKVRLLDSHHCFEGLVAIKTSNGWGFMDINGELVISDKYKAVTDFNKGVAIVETKKEILLIDKKGNETPLKTEEKIKAYKNFSEDMAAVEINGRFGFINKDGELQVEPNFVTVGYFKNGLAWARSKENKLGFINNKGEWVIEPKYFAAKNFDTKSGIAMVKDKTEWIYIDIKGNPISIKEENIESYKEFEDGVALAKSNGLWGYLSIEGTWAIKPQFEGATEFFNDYARIKKDGKWGVINKKGELVLKPIYDNIKPFYIVPN